MDDDWGSTVLAGCLLLLALWACAGLLVAWGIEWAWNELIPPLLHGPFIDFVQACLLYFLVSLIIGGFKVKVTIRRIRP